MLASPTSLRFSIFVRPGLTTFRAFRCFCADDVIAGYAHCKTPRFLYVIVSEYFKIWSATMRALQSVIEHGFLAASAIPNTPGASMNWRRCLNSIFDFIELCHINLGRPRNWRARTLPLASACFSGIRPKLSGRRVDVPGTIRCQCVEKYVVMVDPQK